MATPAFAGHRRNKSSSVLKSIIAPKSHKRSPSDGTALNAAHPESRPYNSAAFVHGAPLLPPDHPHSQLRAYQRTQNMVANPPSSPRKSQDAKSSPTKSLHKKTLSSVSLRSLAKDKDKDKERAKESRSRERSRTRGDDTIKSTKKTKSSSNLAGLFGKGKQSKDGKQTPGRDKENTTPPSSSNAPEPVHTPIWAEFSSQPLREITTTSKIPLNDQRLSIEEEIALYTPQDYSPSKQRNFFDYGQPSLQKKPQVKERPKSTFLPSTGSTTSLLETLTRKRSTDRVPLGDTKGNEGRAKDNASSRGIVTRGMLRRTSSESSREGKAVKQNAEASKKPNRVMAAVAAFNGKAKQAERHGTPVTSPTKLDPKVVDAEFEAVLVSFPSPWRTPQAHNALGVSKYSYSPARPNANAETRSQSRLRPYSQTRHTTGVAHDIGTLFCR